MGYRSDVAIKCREKAFGMIMNAIYNLDENFEHDFIGSDHDYRGEYVIQWTDVKWYEGYKEIDAVEETLDTLDNQYKRVPGFEYAFVRFGENYEDIETRENSYDLDLYVLRDIGGVESCREMSQESIMRFIKEPSEDSEAMSVDWKSIDKAMSGML